MRSLTAAPKEKLGGELGHLHPVDPERVAKARARLLSAEDATRLASLLAMMADPMRARILYALDTVDELCVGDLVLVLGASQDAVGYALRMLRTAGLVVVNRRAGESSTTASQTTSRHRCESTAFAAWSISPAPTTAISA